jgi:anti-sigma factor RsiW
VNCQQTLPLIQAYYDGELDAANTLQVDQHLADCPQCFGLTRNLGTLRTLLRDDALRYRPPAELRSKIRATLADATRTERDSTRGQFAWWRIGLAAAALVAVYFAFQLWPSRSEDPLLAELTSSHVRSLMVAHLTDVASSDQHTVKPWFDGKLDFAPSVKDLREAGFPLLGGRLDYVAARPVAALVYSRQKHLINLFVWPANRPGRDTTPRAAERNGYHLIHWSRQGMTFWAVSDLNEKELMDFAQLLSGA